MTNDIDLGIVAQGPQGKSAYDVAIDNGFKGTQQEWLKSLKVKGDKGDTGNNGNTPVRGTDYWTDADKKAIQDENKQYIDTQITDAYTKAKADIEELIENGKW